MPLLIVLAVVIGFLLFSNTHHGPTPPPGVVNCSLTSEAADQLSELDLYNARAWIMRECDDIPIPDITQATLDCENNFAGQYPPVEQQTSDQARELYAKQRTCPGEPPAVGRDGTPFYIR